MGERFVYHPDLWGVMLNALDAFTLLILPGKLPVAFRAVVVGAVILAAFVLVYSHEQNNASQSRTWRAIALYFFFYTAMLVYAGRLITDTLSPRFTVPLYPFLLLLLASAGQTIESYCKSWRIWCNRAVVIVALVWLLYPASLSADRMVRWTSEDHSGLMSEPWRTSEAAAAATDRIDDLRRVATNFPEWFYLHEQVPTLNLRKFASYSVLSDSMRARGVQLIVLFDVDNIRLVVRDSVTALDTVIVVSDGVLYKPPQWKGR
ncbi:hypothetical protein GF324_06215 [bacterium]|nr:hypothetical protein [bacterium]